jgi:hypothetical protein
MHAIKFLYILLPLFPLLKYCVALFSSHEMSRLKTSDPLSPVTASAKRRQKNGGSANVQFRACGSPLLYTTCQAGSEKLQGARHLLRSWQSPSYAGNTLPFMKAKCHRFHSSLAWNLSGTGWIKSTKPDTRFNNIFLPTPTKQLHPFGNFFSNIKWISPLPSSENGHMSTQANLGYVRA